MARVTVGLAVLVVVSFPGVIPAASAADSPRVTAAQQFFRGVYGCDHTVVRELASSDVIVSYPVFEELFGTTAFRGAEAVEAFAKGFCERWADAEFTFHESLADGPLVVLVWSFSAEPTGHTAKDSRSRWGGISLFRFNEAGKITAEVGEESAPGPMARLKDASAR